VTVQNWHAMASNLKMNHVTLTTPLLKVILSSVCWTLA